MTWIVNKNMPGYLPESEPTYVDTFSEALDVITYEVSRDLDVAWDGLSFTTQDEDARKTRAKIVEVEEFFERELEKAREREDEPQAISFHVLNMVYFAERQLES